MKLAPGIGDEEKLEQVFLALVEFSAWSITEVIRHGGKARARVMLYSDGRQTEMVVPLSLIDGNWTVDSQILVTTELDFVPLEK